MFFEPTDRRKAIKPFLCNRNIAYASPNLTELKAMADFLIPNNNIKRHTDLDEIIELSKIVLKSVNFLIVTRGPAGVVTIKNISESNTRQQLEVRIYNSKVISSIENASGAGDCFSSGFICGILEGIKESQSICLGFKTAEEALLSKDTVPSKFNIPNSFDKAEYSVFIL